MGGGLAILSVSSRHGVRLELPVLVELPSLVRVRAVCSLGTDFALLDGETELVLVALGGRTTLGRRSRSFSSAFAFTFSSALSFALAEGGNGVSCCMCMRLTFTLAFLCPGFGNLLSIVRKRAVFPSGTSIVVPELITDSP